MMSIKRKGQVGGFVLIATVAVAIAIGTYGVGRIRLGGEMHRQNQQLSDFVADILPPPKFVVEPMLEASMLARNPASLPEKRESLRKLEQAFNTRADYWQKSDLNEGLKSELGGLAEETGTQFWAEVNQNLLPAAARNDDETLQRSLARLEAIYKQHKQAIERLVAKASKAQTDISVSSQAAMVTTLWVLGLLAAAILAMVGGGLWYLLKHTLDPLAQTAETMTRMAGGKLDHGRTDQHRGDEIGAMTRSIEVFRAAAQAQRETEVKQQSVVSTLTDALDELAEGNLAHRIATPLAPEYETLRESFNQSVGRLAELMRKVSASAMSVSTGAAEIRAASDDLAQRNEQQAASLEETAAAMNQVTSIVKETASGASDVQRTIAEAHQEASDGGAVVRQAIEAMAAIERSAQEITQIINVIDSISFQTNLLALNAGVEAARAGDAGKGFAVVANEVRALAQRSADAAKDIKELITNSTEQVSDGVALVGETGTLLETIVTRVGEISERITEIARSTESQAVNLQQVNSAVGDMDRMTQQNAAMVEQSTAASRSLADEANELSGLVGQFRTGADSGAAIAFPSKAARRKAVSPPVTAGNLALKSSDTDEDWTEF